MRLRHFLGSLSRGRPKELGRTISGMLTLLSPPRARLLIAVTVVACAGSGCSNQTTEVVQPNLITIPSAGVRFQASSDVDVVPFDPMQLGDSIVGYPIYSSTSWVVVPHGRDPLKLYLQCSLTLEPDSKGANLDDYVSQLIATQGAQEGMPLLQRRDIATPLHSVSVFEDVDGGDQYLSTYFSTPQGILRVMARQKGELSPNERTATTTVAPACTKIISTMEISR